uniref:PWWP domain-containing protein n=1 Tax=Anopheles quadriannulatus TaxID=34691 RepID=A0A182XA03_ANOQN
MEEELSDGDIVWVKVSNSWWPGEVMGSSRLTEEFLSSLRKKPLAVVKFFQEDSYEYVKNPNFIFKYNCPRKHEFLRKGLEQYRAKMKHMEKFPADVMHAERATGGDPDIVNSTDFLPQKKERHSGAFQDGRSPAGKGKGLKGTEKPNTPSKLNTPPFSFGSGRKTIHEVRILAQPSSTPSDGEAGVSLPTDKMSPAVGAHSVQSSPSQVYHCYKCNNYSANRQNLIMLHIKHCRATYAIGSGGAGGSVGAVSSANTSTPTAPARKASSEKMDESAEEVDPEPDVKPDRARRSLPVADKAKPLQTPIRNVDVPAAVKSEPPSSEKRTRGGRITTPTVQAPKQKKGRQNKLDQSTPVLDEGKQASAKVSEHEDTRPSANVDVTVEDDKEENHRQNRGKGSGSVSHEESPTLHAVKNKTDVKLKNELLADWSEDEQEDDEGDKLVGGVENVEEKNPTKESRKDTPPKDVSPVRTTKASTRKQQKDTKQETKQQPLASKKTAKPEAKNETVAMAKKDAESVAVKETEKDPESPPESSTVVAATAPPVTAATAGSVTAAVVSTSSASSAAPIVSPHATIKYRNIPKKQKREFIEVTNDDVSMVQEKYAVPSREGSTASSSSTTGSNESCAGPSQSIVPPTAPAAERPISAKQLILNRATRGSSKSLSGDEITAATAPVPTDHTTPSVSTDTNAVQEERKSHIDDSAKKTDVQQQETSCFDFNDDEDVHQQEKVSPASQSSLMTARFDRKRDQAAVAREKPTTVEPEPSEVDRDAQLSQEIDSLLGETNVPKLPDDLSDVMTAVSDKIDCNRTLPPKERGKRIFKTRNKTVTASSSSSPKRDDAPVGEEVAPSEESVPAEAANNNGDSSSSASDVVKDKADKEQQPQQQEASEEETQTLKGKDESKNREDDQNPSVTSSAMTDEGLPEDKELQQKQQHQSAKKKRKSDEVLLPDSSGNGDQPTVPAATRRRGKYSKAVTDVHEKSAGEKSVSTQPVSEAREPSSVSRKAKRLRKEGPDLDEATPANTDDSDKSSAEVAKVTKRVVSSEIETSVAMDTAEATDNSNDLSAVEKQEDTGALAKHLKTNHEESADKQQDAAASAATTLLTSKATPTDLQVAEALINLPVVVTASLPVSSSSSSSAVDEDVASKAKVVVVEPAKEADTTASSSTQAVSVSVECAEQPSPNNTSSNSSSNNSSTAKSINPRKRHLQSMMLTTAEATNLPQSKKVAAVVEPPMTTDGIEKEITTVKVVLPPEEDPPSIPEKKKRNEVLTDGEEVASKESSPVPAEVEKLDINSMPIVMDEGELLVDGTSSIPAPAGAITVMKSVNGAGGGAVKPALVAATSKDKRQTTVAMVKGGKASTEQIVITSKGTILTTSTASVSVASKFPSSTKSSVTVTSAITLSSSCRVASSTPAPSVSSPPSTASSAAAPQLVPPKIIITKKPLPHAASTSTASSKAGSAEGSVGSKAHDRRVSGDGASSSVSSSSGSETITGKKSHRVLRLTPQKLKEFSRLGYIEERQGKGKMLTKSGMRQLYGKQQQLQQQQQQQQQQHVSRKKPVPISTKIITTTGGGGADLAVAPDSNSSSARPTSLPEVASSGSNVVIAAAADSSVQESSTTVGRTASTDPSAVDMEEDEEMLEQQKVSSGEAGELPASTHVAPAGGAAILLEGSPSSSGAGAAEVILGSSELAVVGGGSVTEASSSSTGGSGSGTTATGEQESSQLIAVPAENFGGPPHLFYLCSVRDESLVPVNNELLYLDASNQLVALPEQHQQHPSQQQQQQQHQGQQQQAAGTLTEEIINQAEVIIPTVGGSNGAEMGSDGTGEGGTTAIANATGAVGSDGAQEGFVFNTQDGQHIILDPQSLMALAASGDTPHLITADGQEIILQETAQEWLAALSAGQHAQQQQAGAVSTLVTAEGTQIIVAHENAGLIELQEHPVLLPTEIIQVNPNTTVETNAVLTKPPIMSTVEVPTKNGIESASRIGDRKLAAAVSPRMASGSTAPAAGASSTSSSSSSSSSGKALTSTITAGSGSNLDETLAAVIGHVPSNPHVPTSLELPITVTNPVIAKTSTASSRLNATAPLFPLTTTAATVVSSFADAIPAAATVVLVSGADAPAASCPSPAAEGQEARKDNGAEQEELEKESEEASMMTVQHEEGNDHDGDYADDGGGDASGKEKSACFDEDDIQIPSTPESAQNNDERQQQQYDDELMASDDEQREPNENHLLLANENSNCSEIIAIQPNVVVLDGGMLLNSPGNEDDDADDDDGIDDDLMENESEEDGLMTVQQQQHQQQQQVVQDVVQGRSFDQRPTQQAHRARNRVPPAANGANGRSDNTVNLAEHHNSSSNNDSGIDTSMAAGGVASCEAAAASSSGEGTPTTILSSAEM